VRRSRVAQFGETIKSYQVVLVIAFSIIAMTLIIAFLEEGGLKERK